MREIHLSPENSPPKGQWHGALMFSLICVWLNGWVNNREADDLRRHQALYDVTVMNSTIWEVYCWHIKHMMTQYLKNSNPVFPKVLWKKKIYSTVSFRVRILLLRSHAGALQYIGLSSHLAAPVCGHFGLWLFWFAAVSVCGLSVCGRFGLTVSVCGRFGLWTSLFVAVSFVVISVYGYYDLLPSK